MKVALFIANYSIDNSPSILNLISLITKEAFLDLYLFDIGLINSLSKFSNTEVYNNPEIESVIKNKNSSDYHKIICIDPHGFFCCKNIFPNSKPIYYSLELYVKDDHFGLDYPADLAEFERKNINSISALLIQSKEKALAFRTDYKLKSEIPDYYLPVTYSGEGVKEKSDFLRKKYNISDEKKIALHLGGIAEYFSCIDLIREFKKLDDWVLFFQGYPNPTYLNKIKQVIETENITNTIISDTLYSSFEDTYQIIASADVGIAWYNDISAGFRLAGYSSGKISAYFKFGLPIITKKYKSTIDRIENKKAGICINEITELSDTIKLISENYESYSANSLNEFEKTYKFENYIDMLKGLIFEKDKIKNKLTDESYWDKSYEKLNFFKPPADDPIRVWLNNYIQFGEGSCIEIGAYPGRYLTIFGDKGFELNGVDLTDGIKQKLPNWLKKEGYKIGEFIRADFLDHNFNKKYDLVSSFGFIEHFSNWESVLMKHIDLVNDDGYIIIETPNFAGSLQKYLHSLFDKKNLERHNLESMNPDRWEEILIDNDFEVIFSGYFGGFDFWVDEEKRTKTENEYLQLINLLTPLLKTIPENNASYSPYCGIIARKKTEPKISLNVLLTVEFYYPHIGGAEIVVQKIAEGLAAKGHVVTVATTKLVNRNFDELNGVKIKEFDVTGKLATGISGNGIVEYQDYLKDTNFDVMFNYAVQQWATDLAFPVVEYTKNERVNILAPCGYSALEDENTIKWNEFKDYFEKIIPIVLPLYDNIVYHSKEYKDYKFGKKLGLNNDETIQNGIDFSEFKNDLNNDFKKKYKIGTKYLLICVANFVPGKGQEKLIETFKNLNRSDCTLLLVGKEGQKHNYLCELSENVENIKILKNIPREDTVKCFLSADLFLFASEVEAAPLVILEAMASKTPFITTDVGNVKDLEGGIVTVLEDFPENINYLLNNEEARLQKIKIGFEQIHNKYNWDIVIEKYEKLFLELFKKKKYD